MLHIRIIKWTYITESEQYTFMDGLLLSACCPLPNKRQYWSGEDDVPKLLMRSMRRNRFEVILHNLHFCDSLNHSEDRAYKIRPILVHFEKLFIQHRGLEGHLSIDESTILYYGKHYAEIHSRKTHTFWLQNVGIAFKVWILALLRSVLG